LFTCAGAAISYFLFLSLLLHIFSTKSEVFQGSYDNSKTENNQCKQAITLTFEQIRNIHKSKHTKERFDVILLTCF